MDLFLSDFNIHPVMRRIPSVQTKGYQHFFCLSIMDECHPSQVRTGRKQKSVQWLLHIGANVFTSHSLSAALFLLMAISLDLASWGERSGQHSVQPAISQWKQSDGRNSRLEPIFFQNCVLITRTMCPTMSVITHFGNNASFVKAKTIFFQRKVSKSNMFPLQKHYIDQHL